MFKTTRVALGLLLVLAGTVSAAPIQVVGFSDLANITDVRFFGDGTDLGTSPVTISRNFAGQTVTVGGPWGTSEILSGSPSAPLTYEDGAWNLCYFPGAIAGKIENSCGEGSLAFLFDSDQSEIGLEFLGLNGGTITLDFFRNNGSLIERISISPLGDSAELGFRLPSVGQIRGFSVFNEDFAGIAIGKLAFGARQVPEPSTLALLGLGLAGLAFTHRRRAATNN